LPFKSSIEAPVELGLVADGVIRVLGDEDLAGIRGRLEARGRVHHIAEDVVLLQQAIAGVHADAREQQRLVGLVEVDLLHPALDGGSRAAGREGVLEVRAIRRRWSSPACRHWRAPTW
jgi:hypothetical protein